MDHVRYLRGRHRTLVQLRAQCESSFGRHLSLQYGILNLLYDFADNKFSSDDRDKVFALLGLLSPDQALITPDYGLNVQEVFKDTARAWINKYESLLVIELVDGAPPLGATWYLDWSNFHSNWVDLFWAGNITANNPLAPPWRGQFSASGGQAAVKCSLEGNRDVIRVRWLEHDVVELVEPYNVATWERTWEKARDSARVQPYDFPVAAFESNISAGMYPEYTNGMKSVEHCQRASATRTFFVTKRGFFGPGNKSIQVGDVCAVLLGSDVPFLLRKERERFLDSRM
jgi:hypothetical protein